MLKTIWKEITSYLQSNESATLSEVSESTGAPISTVAYHQTRTENRIASSGTDQWETAWGQNFLKRMIITDSTLEELEVVLGLDETWLDDMLLVCQDLISGYLFLKSQVKVGTKN